MKGKLFRSIEKYHYYIFAIILFVFYIITNYFVILFKDPEGIHFIRQTDSLSFASIYLRNGFNFFSPGVFNQNSIEGKAACEFPIMYYITAILYKIFGEKIFILRILNFAINLAAVIYLYKLIVKAVKDKFFSLLLLFIFISSEIYLYYANNFLPDSTVLGLTIIGWYFFYKYWAEDKKLKTLIYCFSFFGIASLIKVTYFINPFSAMLSLITYDILKKEPILKTLKNNLPALISIIIITTIILAWNIFVTIYNKTHNDYYFLIKPNPFWDTSKEWKEYVFSALTYKDGWLKYAYSKHAYYMFIYISISSVLLIVHSIKKIIIPTIFLIIGSVFYFFLFFAQFKDHDYYLLVFYIPLFFIIINSVTTILNRFPNANYILPKLILLAVLITNFERECNYLNLRYKDVKSWDAHSQISYIVKENNLSYVIDSLNIGENAKFVVMKDITPNGGLLFIKRQGWNVGYIGASAEYEVNKLNELKNRDFDYVLYTQKDYLNYTIAFNQEKIYEKGEISIYKVVK